MFFDRRMKSELYASTVSILVSPTGEKFPPNSRASREQREDSPFSRRNLLPRGNLSSPDRVLRREDLRRLHLTEAATFQLEFLVQTFIG